MEPASGDAAAQESTSGASAGQFKLKLKLTAGPSSTGISAPVSSSNEADHFARPTAAASTSQLDAEVALDRDHRYEDAQTVLSGREDGLTPLSAQVQQLREERDEANLALHRSQKIIIRLRQDKEALLDRVLELESAAGLTSAEVDAAHQRAADSSAATLIDSPTLPSLQDRERRRPVLTTTTDLTKSTYNDPIDPPAPPTAFPPRRRSQPLRTALASKKLREDAEMRRAAKNLPKAAFPAVAVLGLEGSTVAENVERALAGEVMAPPPRPAPSGSTKRKRESSKASTSATTSQSPAGSSTPAFVPQAQPATAPAQAVDHLPNPFAPPLPPLPSVPPQEEVPELSVEPDVEVPKPSTEAQIEAMALSQAALQHVPLNIDESHLGYHHGDAPIPVDASLAVHAGTSASPPLDLHHHQQHAQLGFSHGMYDTGSPEGSFVSGDDDDDLYGASSGSKRRKSSKSLDIQYDAQGKALKPKRMAKHGLSTGTYYIPHIVRNPDGTPRLPMMAGIIQIRKLGQISLKDNFHTERYIFPVGYESSRKYPSMVQKSETVEYVCRIVDAGEGAPRFEITPSDQPGAVISAGTPTGAWAQIVREVNRLRERNHSNSVSGPDYYGLSQNVVKAMIQELPRADEVPNYIWQNFLEEDQAPADAQLEGRKIVSKKIQGPKRRFKDPNRAEQVAAKQHSQHHSTPRLSAKAHEYHPDDLRVADTSYSNGHDDNGDVYHRHPSEVDSSPGSNSPAAFHHQREYTPSSSLHTLMNPVAGGSSTASANPYSIPVGGPAIDPALSAGGVPGQAGRAAGQPFDPYAIPAPVSAQPGASLNQTASWTASGYSPFDIPTSGHQG